jgi:hypothetical protein
MGLFNPKSWLLILFGAAIYAYNNRPVHPGSNESPGRSRFSDMRYQVLNPKD